MTKLNISILLVCAVAAVASTFLLDAGSPDERSHRDAAPTADGTVAPSPSDQASAERTEPMHVAGSDVRRRQSVLAHEVDDLRRQLEQVQEDGARPRQDASTPAPVADDPEIDGHEHAQEMAESFEQQLVEQPVDAEWAAGMHERFDQFFAMEQVSGSHVGPVDCRSTLCRIEVSFDDLSGRDALIDQVSGLLEPNAQGFAHIEDDGDLKIQVYLSRQDMLLPAEG